MALEASVEEKVADSHRILSEALETHLGGRELAAVALLFSGGRDSTVLAHLFRDRADCAIHANTTVGIEETRQFVRDTCRDWGLPLLEELGPRSYADLVRGHGFPGPAQHYRIYQRLKERALRQARRALVADGRKQRVVFLAGRRRAESARRTELPEHERVDSVIWASPLVHWTSDDLNSYQRAHPDLPVNPVAANLHMSGECLCGCFAKPGEREEISWWYPEAFTGIAALEAELADREDIRPARRCWGWGADWPTLKAEQKAGPLCSSCEFRAEVSA